jgi:hypothetical protein
VAIPNPASNADLLGFNEQAKLDYQTAGVDLRALKVKMNIPSILKVGFSLNLPPSTEINTH